MKRARDDGKTAGRKLAALSLTALLAVGALFAGPCSGDPPSATVTYPAPGTVLNSRSLNITGTAIGSVVDWTETSEADFNAGANDSLRTDGNGSLVLDLAITDDFNDNSLNMSMWAYYNQCGMHCEEANGTLHHFGTWNNTGGLWEGSTMTQIRYPHCTTELSVDLVSLNWSGYYFETWLMDLYSPNGHPPPATMGLTIENRDTGGEVRIRCYYTASSTFFNWTPGPHNFRIRIEGGMAYFYMDWVLLGSFLYTHDVTIYPVFYSSVRDNWTTLDVNWDNYRSRPALNGWYVSSVHDSRTESPLLKKIAWSADVAANGTLTVDVRSSDDPNMTGASPWVPVSNGQTTGFPSARRYLQYRASLSRPYGEPSPVFRDITLSYQVQVAKVEVSTDGRNTWSQAEGREHWYANVVAPENHSLGWVRVTDVLNSTKTSSFPLDCDTTPPYGNVAINDGDDYAGYPGVNLTIFAWDLYNVTQMKISTSEDFQGAVWIPFNTSARATLEPGDGIRTVYIRFRDNTGWESAVFNDTIEMHTNPPVGSVIINGGAAYSPKNLVVLTMNATHPLGVQEMMISDRDDFADASWVPYENQCNWSLPTGMGERYVFVIFKDQFGHISATARDGIIVDTQPPVASLLIDGGAKYTVSSTVNVTLAVIENIKTTAMQVGEDQQLIGEVRPQPFRASFPFNLSSGDGSKTIYVRVTDGAGNVGPVNSSSIILDTTPPACTVSPLPQNISVRSFQVQWSASDVTSGLAGYDIQYRDGNGTWTDWKLMSNETGSIFTGKDGHAYSFRVRATDAAGNLGDYCDPTLTVVNIVVPTTELPNVSIEQPANMAVLKGVVQITGRASHPDATKQILEVSVQLDEGPWVPADGTVSWAFILDTIDLTEGPHVIRARSFDGLRYSAPSEIDFSVKNEGEPIPGPGPGGGTDVMPILFGMLAVVIIAAGIGWFLLVRRKKDQTPPGT